MKVNFIIPYFGNFPNYMQLFLNSCEKNLDFNWTIITDNIFSYKCPKNVRVIRTTFEELISFVRSKFDFEIAFNKPYKLCDMKPMYGYLFEEYNQGYEYWGYCDVDIILGRLNNFITKEALEYDKLFTNGHMTLMKNNDQMNRLFMKPINGVLLYKKVLQTEKSCNFDEDFLDVININTICRENNINVYSKDCIADIYTKSSNFRRVKSEGVEPITRSYYIWDDGVLYRRIRIKGKWFSEEYMYIHLQKRKMTISISENEKLYKIIPNEFAELEIDYRTNKVREDKIKCKNFNLQYFRIRCKNLLIKIKSRIFK